MGTPRRSWPVLVLVLPLALACLSHAEEGKPAPDPAAARRRGLEWLAKNANEDGSFGRTHTVAVTGLACLAWLAASDEPWGEPSAPTLLRALEWLDGAQTDGVFTNQGHTWIHGQGFATLALSEAYGRGLFCKTKPDLDLARLRRTVLSAARVIAESQSSSGGWWYTRDGGGQHEGSTTVCAVQALVSASNFGVPIDQAVLERGFEYLKRCQNPDGGFDYMEGPGTESMKEGTAADVATLALMRKFDYDVMVGGTKFLKKMGPAVVSVERFPYYGHFYACMGLRLFGEEMDAMPDAQAWSRDAVRDLLAWQQADGSWPLKSWMVSSGGETPAYATAFAALILSVPDARLSVLRRTPPTLPATAPREGAPVPAAPAR
jgi:hypothetical protein